MPNKPRPNSETFRQAVAHLMAELLDEARLRREAEKRYLEADKLARQLMKSQEEERHRVCYDIHDGVAQTLVPALHYLQVLETLPASRQDEAATLILKARLALQQALSEVRAVIEDLRVDDLGNLSLTAALRLELERYQEEQGWEVEFVADEPDLGSEEQALVFRIIKEGLNNIRKHAATTKVSLILHQQAESGFEIVLRDWGIGFDPQDLPQRGDKGGIGLIAMQKRAQQLNATLEINSQKGEGTTLRLVLP